MMAMSSSTLWRAEGVEDTWPLAYQYTMNGPTMSYAIVQSCAPTYQGALEILNEVIHNGVPFSVQEYRGICIYGVLYSDRLNYARHNS